MSKFSISTHDAPPSGIRFDSQYADLYEVLGKLSPGQWLKVSDISSDEISKFRAALAKAKKAHPFPNVTTRMERDVSGNTINLWIGIKTE